MEREFVQIPTNVRDHSDSGPLILGYVLQCTSRNTLRPVSTPVGPSWMGVEAVPNSR